MVDDEEGGGKQEMVYEVTAGEEKRDRSIETVEREETDGKDRLVCKTLQLPLASFNRWRFRMAGKRCLHQASGAEESGTV
jgi:hypothetical protein